MIKIIEPGTLRRVTCNSCGAVLSYDEKEDVKIEAIEDFSMVNGFFKREQRCIMCPQCNTQIVLSTTR